MTYFLYTKDGCYINVDTIDSVYVERDTARIYLKGHDYHNQDSCDYEIDVRAWEDFLLKTRRA